MHEQVGWVPTRSGLVFTALHAAVGPTAVVLVPPFGWEAMASARSLRVLARELASAGHPTVRFHLPGTGDSAGGSAVQDLSSWTAAVVDLVGHTRTVTGGARVCVVGLGLGGVLACLAAAESALIDDLVLWATPSRGRLLLRELRAFAAMTGEPGPAASGFAVPSPLAAAGAAPGADAAAGSPGAVAREADDGVLWVHGYPLSAAAQEQLTALDLTSLPLSVDRALVLGRGTLPADARLVAALRADAAAGLGYDELTVEPRLSQPPAEVLAQLLAWLPLAAAPTDAPEVAAPPASAAVVPREPGPDAPVPAWAPAPEGFGERQVRQPPVSAVVHDVPAALLTAVFVGAGATARSGPNRLWVEAARRWTSVGVASLRLDLEGIGEADGPDSWAGGPEGLYVERYRAQVAAALDLAVQEGLPPRFLLVGLCSGGLWSAQAALDDDRVQAVVALNSYGLVWPPPLTPLGPRARLRHLTRLGTWTPLLHDPVLRADTLGRVRRSGQLLVGRRRRAPRDGRPRRPATTLQVLTVLESRGVQVTVGASPGEPVLDDLALLPAGSRTRVVRFAGPRGAHTLSPAGLRAQAAALLDEAARAALP